MERNTNFIQLLITSHKLFFEPLMNNLKIQTGHFFNFKFCFDSERSSINLVSLWRWVLNPLNREKNQF